MNNLVALFLLERKRFLKKWNLILWLFIMVFILLSINRGVNNFEHSAIKKQGFKEIQDNYFKSSTNDEGYGRDGVKLFFEPAPASVISNNSVIPPDMAARVDSIVMLQIYNNVKGKSLARGIFPWRPDFSNIVFLLLTLTFF